MEKRSCSRVSSANIVELDSPNDECVDAKKQKKRNEFDDYCFVPHLLQKVARIGKGAPQLTQNFPAGG